MFELFRHNQTARHRQRRCDALHTMFHKISLLPMAISNSRFPVNGCQKHRAYQEITLSNRGSPWHTRGVPLAVEVMVQDSERSHVFIGECASQRRGVRVEK